MLSFKSKENEVIDFNRNMMNNLSDVIQKNAESDAFELNYNTKIIKLLNEYVKNVDEKEIPPPPAPLTLKNKIDDLGVESKFFDGINIDDLIQLGDLSDELNMITLNRKIAFSIGVKAIKETGFKSAEIVTFIEKITNANKA